MTLFKPTRRHLLETALIAPLLALPAIGSAAILAPSEPQSAGFHRFRIGEIKVTVLSDGNLVLPTSGLGINATPEEVTTFLEAHALSTTNNYSHTNHVLIETGDKKILVDVGSGERFQASAGRLLQNMENAGIDSADITHVFITHAHPDHIWGIRDDFDEAIFPDAEYIIGGFERDWWMQDGLVSTVTPAMQQFVVGAVNSLTVEGVEWTIANDGYEIANGVRLIDTPGHTLGHMSMIIESEGQSLIVLGDSMSHAYMSFEQPKWVNGFDMDGDKTVATRMRLLDMAATDRMAVLGYHFPFPGVGNVVRSNGEYRFIPALWRWQEQG